MQRFIPVLRYAWLALKRNNCNRDMRQKIITVIKRNQFNWETELLKFERIHQWHNLRQKRSQHWDNVLQIQNCVDLCDAIDGDDVYRNCILQRVKVRVRNYSPGKWHWYWLQNEQ